MKPTSRFDSRPPSRSGMLQVGRLVVGLALVAMFMFIAWQKAQQPERQAVDEPAAEQSERPVQVKIIEPKEEPESTEIAAEPQRESPSPATVESQAKATAVRTSIKNQKIRDQNGKVVFTGTVELQDTLERIARGERGSHGNDGSVFQNREKRLPVKPSGYYREWVHPTPKLRGPGPQRVVTGEEGEIYYTPDHYQSFQRLDKSGQDRAGEGK